MSRDDSIAESAKQRSLRVALDHYRQPNPLVRTKFWLSIVAAAASIVYVVWLLLPTPASRQQASPGLLAAVHSTWNNDCAICHQDFQPLRSDAINIVGLFRDSADRESLDQKCLKCHQTAVHHTSARTEDVQSCAACHQEHQGPAANILRARDATCLRCHENVATHRDGTSGLHPEIANVSGFSVKQTPSASAEHPEFRSLTQDPGNIKFNHWLHLQPGIATSDSKNPFKLADLDEAQRRQYSTYARPDGLLQLQCAACHEPDSSGATMQPIAFARHCQACHPLAMPLAVNSAPLPVPHGLSSERLTAVLDGLLLAAERGQTAPAPPTADESGDLPLIPGRTLGANLAQKISQDMLGRRNTALRAVSVQCLKCHEVQSTLEQNGPELAQLLPAALPTPWFRHARFDHRAHRHVDCRSCHSAAFAFEQHDKPQFLTTSEQQPSASATARDSEQVMIAGLENCTQCHAPARGIAGGARFDCAECHTYHGGDHKLNSSLRSASYSESTRETPDRKALAAPALPNQSLLQLVSFQPPIQDTATFTSVASCASSGCHGNIRPDSQPWQTAFHTWASHDPHAQAFEVLWTYRGREMTRLLSGQSEQLTDTQHSQALDHRCIGCHATPPPPDTPSKPAHYALGVQCESCHGPASGWVHTHDQTDFRRDTSGFLDTKDLEQRARACLQCHVGPSDATHPPQAVDHDLIAAGHPRLNFEFHSYLASLPAHWDRQRDEARIPTGFHFQTWRVGQLERTKWDRQHPTDPLTDFAVLDCSSCHHSLVANAARLQPALALLPSPPSTNIITVNGDFSTTQRLALARDLLSPAAGHPSTWEGALRAYLALQAITADEPLISLADWKPALSKLGLYLAQECFPSKLRDKQPPSPYDSPSRFDPNVWQQQIEPVVRLLRQLEASTTAP